MFTENRSCAVIKIRVSLPTLSCRNTALFRRIFVKLGFVADFQFIIKERSCEATMGGGVRGALFRELVSLKRQVGAAHGHPLVQTY